MKYKSLLDTNRIFFIVKKKITKPKFTCQLSLSEKLKKHVTEREGEEGSATTTTTDTSEEPMHTMSAGLDEIVLADIFNYLLRRLYI